jgi:hypothetical protein
MILAISVLFVFWLGVKNFGLSVQQNITHSADDIAAWDGNLFVLQADIVKKLDSDLEVTRKIVLPPDLPPLPPEPNIGQSIIPEPAIDNNKILEFEQADILPAPVNSNRIAADKQYVYVLYKGTLFVFDHNLNHIKSKILD